MPDSATLKDTHCNQSADFVAEQQVADVATDGLDAMTKHNLRESGSYTDEQLSWFDEQIRKAYGDGER